MFYKSYNETPTEGFVLLNILTRKKTTEPTPLEQEIARLLDLLKDTSPETEDYAKTSDQLVKLYKLNEETILKKRVSPDALTNAATNLFGILLILNFEHAHVLTSKALGFVVKTVK